jgi:glycosyltransferase involved in cell wall biosynthesis
MPDNLSLRVTQIIASLDNAAAGPSYTVTRLAETLAARGFASEILCTGSVGADCRAGVATRKFPLDGASVQLLKKFAVSRALGRAIDAAAAAGHVLHSNGLWLMPNLYPALSARRHGAPHVLSPHGMLVPAALNFSRRRKHLVWWLAQRRAVENATCLHATSRQECDELRALGIKVPVAIVPNGIDMPAEADVVAGKARRDGGSRTLLYLGRIHPKKGIDRLIEAWAQIETRFPDWWLRIVGPSEGRHGEALAARAASLGLTRVRFEDSLFGAAKDAAYTDSDLFVLPTLNENFGMVVAEALANGTPVICTKGAPWSGLEAHGCGWWIEHGIEPLVSTLGEALARPAVVLDLMGARGRTWMAAEFSWDKVADDMERVYRWCLRASDRPEIVETAR